MFVLWLLLHWKGFVWYNTPWVSPTAGGFWFLEVCSTFLGGGKLQTPRSISIYGWAGHHWPFKFHIHAGQNGKVHHTVTEKGRCGTTRGITIRLKQALLSKDKFKELASAIREYFAQGHAEPVPWRDLQKTIRTFLPDHTCSHLNVKHNYVVKCSIQWIGKVKILFIHKWPAVSRAYSSRSPTQCAPAILGLESSINDTYK